MKNHRRFLITLGLTCGLLVAQTRASNPFNITINYTGNEAYRPYFTTAESVWERIIPSYINGNWLGVTDFTGIVINASVASIDGIGGSLAESSPTAGNFDDQNFALTTTGFIKIDSADIAGLGANLQSVIIHEMAHVIGLGSAWGNFSSLYTIDSGQYTGASGLAAYKQEFNQPTAIFVPVELEGGDGRANGHWDESYEGAALTGILSNGNRDMAYELMTAWFNADKPNYISSLTRDSFKDIGYNTQVPTVVWTATTNDYSATWGTAGNWSGGVPTAFDSAVFSNTGDRSVTLSGTTYSIDTLQLNNSGALTIKQGGLNAWTINATGTGLTKLQGVTVNNKPNLTLSSGSQLKFLNLEGNAPASLVATNVTGSGVIEGNITIEGTHSAGGSNAVGSQTFLSNLAYASSSVFEWDLNTSTESFDSLMFGVGGSLAVADGATFKVFSSTAFTDTFWNFRRSWSVMDDFDMSNFTLSYVANGVEQTASSFADEGYFSFSTDAGDSLVWSPVPELTSSLAGLLLAGGLLRRHREPMK